MQSTHIPWWMFVAAASFLLMHALGPYLLIWGPTDPREMEATFEHGALQIRAVTPGTPLAEAGLQTGDQILSIGGLPVRNAQDWSAVLANRQAGRPQTWMVLRGDRRLEIAITPQRAAWEDRLVTEYIVFVSLVITCFPLGLLIAFRRPGDIAARIGAWFITTASVVFGLPNGWAVPWRQLPALLQALLWIPELCRFVPEGIFLSFFAVFPCRLFRARWPWILIWAPVLVTLPWRISRFSSVIYHPAQPSQMPSWVSQVANIRPLVYVAAAVVMLSVSYFKLADQNAKRRVRVLMVGTAISLLAAIPVIWHIKVLGQGLRPGHLLVMIPFFPFTLACPLAFAYAILRHRVLDVQVILRQSLRYALTRGAVLGVVPFAGGILAFDLVVNRQEPLAQIVQARGWIYAALAVLACLAYWRRKPWLEIIDRRFFREHYDAQRVLGDVVRDIRTATNIEYVAPQVVARIESSLHPEFAFLMVHEPGQASYRTLASAPPGQTPPALAADSKLVALARLFGKPMETFLTDSGWLDRRLPDEEIEMVRRTRLDLLVPIPTAAGSPDALLALGIKRSEEPYTREDQELLATIAASLGFLLDRPLLPLQRTSGMFEECPRCGVCCEAGSGKCRFDGTDLIPMPFSQVLAGRYHLNRRRGRGGMGAVYEATDKTLERRVAVKVIREDWLNSADAAHRFQREARAAAAFSHPNVVTVYDYGVEADARAFLVMELLEGATLRDELGRNMRLTAARTIEVFRPVCSAVEAAHRRQLIHRDLKPENIFLAQTSDTGGETVKILDFGVAKFVSVGDETAETKTIAETGAGVLVGTLGYMSPEQLLGERPAISWDLWALAVVVYESLTGVLPFPRAAGEGWHRAVLAGNYIPLSHHFPDVPAAWLDFFARCFATDRARRPASAAEFSRHLDQALAGPAKAPAQG